MTGADAAYTLQLQQPNTGSCHGGIAGTGTDADIAAGQVVHLHYTLAAYAGSYLRCPGRTTGTIYYAQTTDPQGSPVFLAPGGGTASVPVGSFSFQVK